jgi:hypothetical protein
MKIDLTSRILTVLTVAILGASCGYNTGESGVKPVGVGYEPGDLFPGPEARGGLIDAVYMQLKGQQMDLGVTGLFLSLGAFTNPQTEPFETVLSFGYFFSPAIVSADEWQFISPKGPDIEDACFVQLNSGGPLGSLTTVDVGDRVSLTNLAENGEDPSRLELMRNPQTYPTNTTRVSISYSGTDIYRRPSTGFPGNWSFGQEMEMHFDGGLPPANTPVASIPRPSDAADPRAGKDEAGDPRTYAPDELGLVEVTNLLGPSEDDWVAMRYSPGNNLPNPTINDGVLNVRWTPPVTDGPSQITIGIKALAPDEPFLIDDEDFCVPAEADAGGIEDQDGLDAYNASKERWCDPDYEPDLTLGNDESGNDYLAIEDTCHDGIDSDHPQGPNGTDPLIDELPADEWDPALSDGCDESGCMLNGVWVGPDPDCSRHSYRTASCDVDHCVSDGGGRSPEEHLGELICTATDDGSFTVPADQIQRLMDGLAGDDVSGALLSVSRVNEALVTVPLARDQIGNEDNINPIRLRLAEVQYGRVDWDAE